MSPTDPIQNAWEEARDAERRGCPDAVAIALAGMNGVVGLPEPQREHLLRSDCARCTRGLAGVWARHLPLEDLRGAASSWPADGPLGRALRERLAAAQEPAARELRALLESGPAQEASPERPAAAGLKAVVAERMAAIGALIVGGLLFPPPRGRLGAINDARDRDRRPTRALSTGSFGRGVQLRVSSEATAVLELDVGALPGLRGRDVVVLVLREGQATPVAEARFPAASGRSETPLAIPATLVQSDELRVAIGRLDPG